MADRTGQQIDNYILMRLLGRGTFGEVYLAEHVIRKTQVAMKVLDMRLSNDAYYDFVNEARIFRLQHPNIVPVLDFGIERTSGTPFLVMNYAPNGTLRQRHTIGKQVPLSQVVEYVKQVASALQYAHDESLVHRDVKPENMLLDEQGRILLSDFGIAVPSQSIRIFSESKPMIAGTPEYMAPEQFLGKTNRASDQYALGVVVYEWLSGTLPFRGQFYELFNQHLQTPPPPLPRTIQRYSPAVEEVVLKALAKKPEDRFATVAEFAQQLEEQYKKLLGLYRAPTILVTQTSEQYQREGNTYYDTQRYSEAIAAYTLAIAVAPNNTSNASIYNNRGLAYRQLQDLQKAIADYSSAIELDPNSAFAYNNRGYAYSLLGEFEKAVANYDRALAIEPQYAIAYNNRGNAYSALGIFNRAVLDYSRAIEFDPQYALVYYNRGNAHDELGEPEKAIEDYNKALELDPQYAKAYTNRGYVYRNLGEYEKALTDYNRALELDPGNTQALSGRAITYTQLKQFDRSMADFDRTLELDPNHRSALMNKSSLLRKLRELREASASSSIIQPEHSMLDGNSYTYGEPL